MTMIRTQGYQLGLKIEPAEGTKIALTAADFLPVSNAKFSPDVKTTDTNKQTGSLSPSAGRPGLRMAKISFDYYLRGASAAGTEPESDPLLKACGLDVDVVALTSVALTPAALTVAVPSCTVQLEMDGKIKRIWGARGTAKFAFVTGEPIKVSFEFTGADFEEVDGAKTAGVTYASLPEPVFLGAALTLGGVAMLVTKMDLDLGNTVTLRQSSASNSGYLSAKITARKPTITFDPEDLLVAEYNHLSKWKNGDTAALAVAEFGPAVGNKLAIAAPALQYTSLSEADRGGIATRNITALCCRVDGDDELSFTWT